MTSLLNRVDKDFQVFFYPYQDILEIVFQGTLENDQKELLETILKEVNEYSLQQETKKIVLNVKELKFCFSECLKTICNWFWEGFSRPLIELRMSKATWQVTSLKMAANMAPNLTLGESNGCAHTNQEKVEDSFFAPTGNGSIVTTITCKDCGMELSRSSEYFD